MKEKINPSFYDLSRKLLFTTFAGISLITGPNDADAQTSNEENVQLKTSPISAPTNTQPKSTSEIFTAPTGAGLRSTSQLLSAPSEEQEAPASTILRAPSTESTAVASEVYTAPRGVEPQGAAPILRVSETGEAEDPDAAPTPSESTDIITAPSARALEPRHSEVITAPNTEPSTDAEDIEE